MMAVWLAIIEFMLIVVVELLLFTQIVQKSYNRYGNGAKKNWSMAVKDPTFIAAWLLSILMILNIPRLALAGHKDVQNNVQNNVQIEELLDEEPIGVADIKM